MRDIKFRGKVLTESEFVYGDLIKLNDGRRYIVNSTFGACIDDKGKFINTEEPFVCEVIPSTVAQYTQQNDINGDDIYEGMTVHQISVLISSSDIDFTGEVKFYEGSWWIDSGDNAVLLFNESCENTILRHH